MATIDRYRICLLSGGPSSEREVSLRSGLAVEKALRALGHAVTVIDPVGTWSVPERTDVVFLALHGTYGEDGTVQRELDQQGIAYTGCDAASSELAFDKARTKERLLVEKIPTARSGIVSRADTPWLEGWNPP